MKRFRSLVLVIAGLVLLPAAVAAEKAGDPYEEISAHYESIREALFHDSMNGVAETANAIQERVAEALENPEGTGAGMTEEDASILLTALEEISGAAAELSAAGDLASARESFFALTRPMAKYRKLAGDERTIVAYCSMVKKAWIQPRGEIVNPYYGQAMPRCGEVVGE